MRQNYQIIQLNRGIIRLLNLFIKGAVIIRLEIHKEHNCAILWARTDEDTNVLPPEFSAEIDALRAGNKRFRLIIMRSGSGELFEPMLSLLLGNRLKKALNDVRAEKAV